MVEVDDDVEEVRRVDRAQVLIKISWRPTIQHTVNLHIQGEVYGVHVVEECGCSFDAYHGRHRRDMGSLEEIESDDSDVGTWVPEETHGLEKEGDLQLMEKRKTVNRRQ